MSHRRRPKALSAQDGEPALTGEPRKRSLHHRAYVGVDLVDVGVVAEASGDVDRLEHFGDDLGPQRQAGRSRSARTGTRS